VGTLHLFLKIKVLRPPIEITVQSELSLQVHQRRLWGLGQSSGCSCFTNQFGLLTLQLCTFEVTVLSNWQKPQHDGFDAYGANPGLHAIGSEILV